MENFDAHDAVRQVTARRNEIAEKMRDMRRRLSPLMPSTFSRRDFNTAVRASSRPRWVPAPVTVPALRRQLDSLIRAGTAPMPDFTQDDGYSMCGAEDGFADMVDSAREQAHETLSMLIYQLSRERAQNAVRRW